MNVNKLPKLLALLAVYVFWGGTYLAMKFAIETLPPFLMAGSRFVIAGTVLFLIEILRGTELPRQIHWKNAVIVGGLLLLGGNGGVVWAEQLVPSGIASIFVATVPLWMVLFSWLIGREDKPRLPVIIGLLLGFSGIIILVSSSIHSANNSIVHWSGYLSLIIAAVSWALGSIYSRTSELPKSALMSISLQMLSGGVLCLAAGLLSGEWTGLDLGAASVRSLASLGYLVVFGSIVAFSSYIWLLKVANPAIVSTYAYVNPIVAVILGWSLGGEKLVVNDGVAAIVILISVVIITKSNSAGARAKNA